MNKIVWQPWRDPLLSNFEEMEWPGAMEDEDGDTIPIHTSEKQPVMHTAFGMLSVLDESMASKHFEFWMMHTNFGLTKKVVSLISQIPGIETLEVYTRYRARIGFTTSGLFVTRDVMASVKDLIESIDQSSQGEILEGLPEEIVDKALSTRKLLDNKHKYWTIWIVPNGNIEVIAADKKNANYSERVSAIREAHALVGGRILASESR